MGTVTGLLDLCWSSIAFSITFLAYESAYLLGAYLGGPPGCPRTLSSRTTPDRIA